MKEITARAPATIANLGSAFDCIGLAVTAIYDEVTAKRIKGSRLVIEAVEGFGVPLNPNKNTASIAVKTLLKKAKKRVGVSLKIRKGIPPGSGLGSSAASAAAAVFAVNRLLKLGFSRQELITFAMEGETASAGVAHADNVAPALLGSVVIGNTRDRIFKKVDFPRGLYAVILLPDYELNTRRSRSVLPRIISLQTAAKQWSRVAMLIEGLMNSDDESIAAGLIDEIIEPARKKLIPNFGSIKKAALKGGGALGCTISGGGPSVFALVRGKERAVALSKKLTKLVKNGKIDYRIFVAASDRKGTRIV